MNSLELDFDALKSERQEITDFLSQPNAYADASFAEKNRRLAEIDDLVALGKKRAQLQDDIKMTETDSELASLRADYERELAAVEKELEEMLIPKDPNDSKAAILEIRAGVGGDAGGRRHPTRRQQPANRPARRKKRHPVLRRDGRAGQLASRGFPPGDGRAAEDARRGHACL